MTQTAPSPRTRARRLHERAHYDRDTLHAILDAGLICHIGYVVDGAPVVTPTLYWREGDAVFWHGSSASRMLRASEDMEVCLTVSHLDGLVLARSAFHHSVNYRSAMLFGRARLVRDDAEKVLRLKGLIDGLFPGRWDQMRSISDQELKATRVMWMPIDEASAKIRTGGPKDDAEDMDAPLWAGVAPLRLALGALDQASDAAQAGLPAPVIASRIVTVP
jgi:nitroimidazol reductase NimA-like FMN-containing flavoprotein (pyridoxamine 5'-phosphate oxidase superfamily)